MTELKSFTKPPAGVDKVTAALLILIKGEKKNFTWENGKKMMAKARGRAGVGGVPPGSRGGGSLPPPGSLPSRSTRRKPSSCPS